MVFYFQLQTQLGSLIMIFFVFLYNGLFQIYDGGSIQSPLLGRFCGAQIPAPVSSTQNMMTVKFVTDGSQHNTGFMASYTSSSAGTRAIISIFRPVDWSAICCLCFSWENSSTIGTFVMDTKYCIKSGFHRIQTWAQQNTSSALIFTKLVSMLHAPITKLILILSCLFCRKNASVLLYPLQLQCKWIIYQYTIKTSNKTC